MIRILKYGEVANEEIFARSMPTVNVTDTVAEIIRNEAQQQGAGVVVTSIGKHLSLPYDKVFRL